ncbi:MAG: hypothetical protein HZB61_10340 [Nitrospirae bacterium]|nr:hypothetical protein [Nitrospirota bacterium]
MKFKSLFVIPAKAGIQSFLLIFILLLCTAVHAADISPTSINKGNQPESYKWILATNQSVTGDSDTAVNVDFCTGAKTLTITTAGASVNLTVTPKEGTAAKAIKTYTFTTADTKIISITHPISEWYATSTITAGTVSITFECAGRR